ncbi:MAG: hypothetical protein U0L92_07340 [Clostridia bacterium]|nr:hypothetical protein [Clostridia bacterium]
MGIFSTKNKDNERTVNFMAGCNIGCIKQGFAINATLKEDCIFIKSRINKEMTTTLKYEKITDCQFVTEKDIQEKSKSVAGRAMIGGLALGPVGAIVGGMSGIGNKKDTKTRSFIIINYQSQNDEINAISLEIVGASLAWNKFLSELKEKANIKTALSVEL